MTYPSPDILISNPEEILSWYVLNGLDESAGSSPYNFFEYVPPAKKKLNISNTEDKTISRQLNRVLDSSHKMVNTPAYPKPSSVKTTDDPDIKHIKDVVSLYNTMQENLMAHPLTRSAKHMIKAKWEEESPRLVIIMDMPGKEEEETGEGFTGKENDLVQKMLAYLPVEEKEMMLAYLCPWRSPGQRQLSEEEIDLFRPYMTHLLKIVNPDYVILYGETCIKAMLGPMTLNQARKNYNRPNPENKTKMHFFAMHHPRHLLNTPLTKRNAWMDLIEIKQILNKSSVA